MGFFTIVCAVIIGIIVTQYIQGFIFAAFKADKYEDLLAKKVADRVERVIREKVS